MTKRILIFIAIFIGVILSYLIYYQNTVEVIIHGIAVDNHYYIVEYEDRLYAYSGSVKSGTRTEIRSGYADSLLFSGIIGGEIIYLSDDNPHIIGIGGATSGVYKDISVIETEELNSNRIYLFNGKNDLKIKINTELIYELETQFGVVEYDISELKKYETHYVYSGTTRFIGIILMDDDKMYYGNSNNVINDELAKEIRNVLNVEK